MSDHPKEPKKSHELKENLFNSPPRLKHSEKDPRPGLTLLNMLNSKLVEESKS